MSSAAGTLSDSCLERCVDFGAGPALLGLAEIAADIGAAFAPDQR
jgi:hypothetical protein